MALFPGDRHARDRRVRHVHPGAGDLPMPKAGADPGDPAAVGAPGQGTESEIDPAQADAPARRVIDEEGRRVHGRRPRPARPARDREPFAGGGGVHEGALKVLRRGARHPAAVRREAEDAEEQPAERDGGEREATSARVRAAEKHRHGGGREQDGSGRTDQTLAGGGEEPARARFEQPLGDEGGHGHQQRDADDGHREGEARTMTHGRTIRCDRSGRKATLPNAPRTAPPPRLRSCGRGPPAPVPSSAALPPRARPRRSARGRRGRRRARAPAPPQAEAARRR